MSSPIEKLVKYGISNIDEGLFMGQTILEQLEGIPKHRVHSTKINTENGSASTSAFLSAENENGRVGHGRKLSSESVGSDTSSLRGSGMSNYEILNSFSETELQFSYDGQQVVLPSDQRHKLNRVLMTMQRRLVAAKTDMEDLIARLNQEIAVKDYLTTKVCLSILNVLLIIITKIIRVIIIITITMITIIIIIMIIVIVLRRRRRKQQQHQ